MWRTFASMSLTFGAMAWSIVSATLCFFYASTFWIDRFGRFGAFYSALFSFVVCFYGAKLMLRLADKLVEPYSGPFDSSAYEAAPGETFYRDWSQYAADVVRSRRYAFYARTRQWEKLRALEAETAADLRTRVPTSQMPEPPHPKRTSMAGRVTFDENRRGARRTSVMAPKIERWNVSDDE